MNYDISYFITILSIVGVILNARKIKICFIFWCFTNAYWCIYDFYKGLYSQSILFFIYFLLAIYGFITWSIKK